MSVHISYHETIKMEPYDGFFGVVTKTDLQYQCDKEGEEEEIFSRKFILVFQILNTIPKCRFIRRFGRRIYLWEQTKILIQYERLFCIQPKY